jgi:hypothetical protein
MVKRKEYGERLQADIPSIGCDSFQLGVEGLWLWLRHYELSVTL